LLWNIAYAELFFTDALWPDFNAEIMAEAIEDFRGRERRFGLTGKQLREEPRV
jgi:undecaprenyl diphosphate synthase